MLIDLRKYKTAEEKLEALRKVRNKLVGAPMSYRIWYEQTEKALLKEIEDEKRKKFEDAAMEAIRDFSKQ